MKRVWVHPAAWNEIGEVAEYYEKRREGLGERFFNELERVKSLLCEVQLGAKIDDRHRRAPLSGFPYSIIYRADTSVILQIVAVAHHRRRPYWLDRT